MDLSYQDKALINDLVNIAWQAGAVKSPNMAQALENLRGKILAKPAPKPEEVAK